MTDTMSNETEANIAGQQRWFRADVALLLSKYPGLKSEELQGSKAQYKGLIHQNSLKIKPDYYHLIFDEDQDDETLSLTAAQLCFLVGSDWKTIRAEYLKQKDGKPKVLGHGFRLVLDDVPNELCMSDFNILASQTSLNIKVPKPNGTGLYEIPPIVNLTVALSLVACRKYGRGLFLWQAKLRKGAKNDYRWHIIPDMLFLDHHWRSDDCAAFLKSSFDKQQNYLDAATRLASDDVVLPFVVDFPRTSRKNTTLAQVTAHVDGCQPPLAAISIPGAAYIGWVRDMVLPREHILYSEHCIHPSDSFGSSQCILSAVEKERTRVEDLESMYHRIVSMYDNPIPSALVFYEMVLDRLETAEDAWNSNVSCAQDDQLHSEE